MEKYFISISYPGTLERNAISGCLSSIDHFHNETKINAIIRRFTSPISSLCRRLLLPRPYLARNADSIAAWPALELADDLRADSASPGL
jgi:hypothetical protein